VLLAIFWLPLVFAKSDERCTQCRGFLPPAGQVYFDERCTREVVNQSKKIIYFEEEKVIPDRIYDPYLQEPD